MVRRGSTVRVRQRAFRRAGSDAVPRESTPPPLDLSGGLLRVVGLITPRQVVDENDRSPIAPQMRACSIGARLPVDRLAPARGFDSRAGAAARFACLSARTSTGRSPQRDDHGQKPVRIALFAET